MLRAMVLCAGFGTRLRPLTDELPKPLVPIGDRSILAHIAGELVAQGCQELVINVHHMAQLFEREISNLPLNVQVIHEAEIAGTAGGVAGARSFFSESALLIWNGDILVKPPASAVLESATRHGIALCVVERADGQGTVGLDAQGFVVRVRGERFGQEVRSADYVGVWALSRGVLDEVPERGCLFGDLALPRLRRGGRVATVPVSGQFLDAGEPASLLRANLDWLGRQGLERYVAPGAEVAAGVLVERSLIGKRAKIRGTGSLHECLICDGAEVTAPLSRAIVTPSGRIIPTPAFSPG